MKYEKQILEIIEKHHEKTNGKCGITSIAISEAIGVNFEDLRSTLRAMYEKKMFRLRKGINNQLIFHK